MGDPRLTTIAYDGKTIAADSKISGDINSRSSKLLTLLSLPGAFGGFAGDVAEAHRFFRQFDGEPDSAPAGDYDVLVVYPDGRVVHHNGSGLSLDVTGQRYGLGSGSEYAMGAMAAGKSATEAVEIACELDNDSGGPVETMKVPERPTGL